MRYDPNVHHRRSIRLQGYDYALPGAYFVTICAQNRECLFGEITGQAMQINEAGSMLQGWWAEIANKFPTAQPETHVVMPNHFHGIIIATEPVRADPVGADLPVRPDRGEPAEGTHADVPLPDGQGAQKGAHTGAPQPDAGPPQGTHVGAPQPEIVQWFKTMTTNEYICRVKADGWSPFPGRLWQRNYYERIIRDEDELNRTRQYIIDNPAKWADDPENPILAPTTS